MSNSPNELDCVVIEVFSEDVAEIRSAIYVHLGQQNSKRQAELQDIMDRIYNSLFGVPSKPVLLLDKDGRNMQELKKLYNSVRLKND